MVAGLVLCSCSRLCSFGEKTALRLSEEAETPQTKVLKGNIAAHDVIDVSLELGQAPLEKGIARERCRARCARGHLPETES